MKNTTFKRIFSLALVMITLCGILAIPAFAASTTAYDILNNSAYAKTYTLSNSGKTIPYTTSDLNVRGTTSYGKSSSSYIANSSDELYVMDVGVNRSGVYWAYVSYPSGSKRVNAYIPLSAISDNNGNHVKATSTGKFYCAKRVTDGNSSSYYVAKGDTVYLLSVSGSKYQIMYPISGGKWRIAFCNANDYQKYCGKPQPVANGTYTIVSALNNNKVVDINGGSKNNSANVQLYTNNGTAAQQFELIYNAAGYYTIKNVGSGLVLDVAGGRAASGTNVQQYQSNGTAAQHWYLESAGNGYYYIRSALGYYLDVNGGWTSDGTNIQIWSGNKSNAQKFKFVAKTNVSQTTSSASQNMSYALYKTSGGRLTCGFDGYSSTSGRHEGIDFKRGYGSAVYSLTDGVITKITEGYNGSNGLSTIAIYSATTGKTVVYLHSDPLDSLREGQTVSRGQQIATEAWRGCSKYDDTHTHVEVRDGKRYGAAKSVRDYTLDNANPTSFWNSQGYLVK